MSLVGLKCPNCNGDIQMDDSKENGFCMYCGTSFIVNDEIQRVKVEHSGTVSLNRKEESENFAILGEQKYSEKTSFTAADVKNIMENYVDKSLVLDMTNQRALDLKANLNDLTEKIKKNQIIIDQKHQKELGKLERQSKNLSTFFKVSVLFAILFPLLILVACNILFAN